MPSGDVAHDTIAAVATPAGRGGIGVVRTSGPRVRDIALAVLGQLPKQRRATHVVFRDTAGEALDEGIALFFPAPHSYTGEDVLELQGHGGPVVLRSVLFVTAILGLSVSVLLYCTYPRFRHWAEHIAHPGPRLKVR